MSDASSNPLLAKIKLPGRIFQLPSRGMFYKNGELAEGVHDGEIHVHPMSAMDEINMKNPDQLFSGRAVDEVFKECIPDIKKPLELLAKDVDAIMLFLRTVTYGPGFEITVKHTCENAKEHSYIVDVDQLIQNAQQIDPTTLQLYSLTLQNGQVVKLQPSKYSQVLELIKRNQNKTQLDVNEMKENLKSMLCGIIYSVDDTTNPEHIAEWVSKLQAPLANRIAEKIDQVNSWGSSLMADITCKDCGEIVQIEVPINPVSFFTE